MPVSVSAANYAETSSADLFRALHEPAQVNPADAPAGKRAREQTFVFAPGDLYSRDMTYEDICRRLTPALAQRGFINAADEKGRVANPDRVDLVLRVTAGTRYWRDPTVRLEQLTWKQGLEPKEWTQITLNGGQVTFDRRRGGDDDALAKTAGIQDAQEGNGTFGGAGGSGAYNKQGNVNPAFEYNSTREFFLLVVDAFDYAELQRKGDAAKRVWSTFIAMPRQDKELFSDVLPTFAKIGGAYFGETTRGMQMFDDARARVTPGELKVIESDVKLPEKR